MKLTVLGRYGPFPAPGGACSCYLLEGKSPDEKSTARVVLDMGNGGLSKLMQVVALKDIDAIILSHLHSDHMGDMLILRYALQQLSARGADVPMPLTVIAPPKPELEHRMLASSGTFDMVSIHDGMKMKIGPLSFTFHRGVHPIESYSMEVVEQMEERPPLYGDNPIVKRFVYTGDTGMHDGLHPLFEKAAMVLADTCFLAPDKTTSFAPHLTAAEAGMLAKKAGVGRLLCTHVWGGGYTDEEIAAEAREHFPSAEVVKEMGVYYV